MIEQYERGEITLFSLLEKLPSDEEREFELSLNKIIDKVNPLKLKTVLKEALDHCDDKRVCYAAFYGLNTLYRRNQDVTLLQRLFAEYGGKYTGFKSYDHLNVMFLMLKGDTRNIIEKAYKAMQKLSSHAGAIHDFAEIVVSVYEDEENAAAKENIKNRWMDEALTAIDIAIELDVDYAKFYCTKGRILETLGRFNEARDYIKTAMDKEDSAGTNYARRIGNYQYYLLLIQANHHTQLLADEINVYKNDMLEKQKEVLNKMEESKFKNLEFLGFFAALISFTIGSIQILNHQDFDSAVKLILILMGSTFCVFSGFGVVLHGIKGKLSNIIIFVIGLIVLFAVLVIK